MRRFSLFIVTTFAVGIIVFAHLLVTPISDSYFPLPTDRHARHEESREQKMERKAYYESLHKAAPGVNWKEMDHQTRREKAQLRFQQIRAQSQMRVANDFAKDTVADGKLIAYWREGGSLNQAGRILTSEYEAETGDLYVASDGGNIWKGNLEGDSWEVMNDLFQIEDIHFLKLVSNGAGKRMLAATSASGNDAFYYSDDYGKTWASATGLSGVLDWGYIARIALMPDSAQTLYALAREWDYINWNGMTSLYRSTDNGTSFSQILTWGDPTYGNENKFDIWTNPDSLGKLYIAENQNLHYLTLVDTLSFLGTNPHLAAVPGRIRLRGSDTTLYIAHENSGSTEIFQTKDEGTNWLNKGIANTWMFRRSSFDVSPNNPEHLLIGGINSFTSTDGGSNWLLVNEWYDYYDHPEDQLHADIPSYQFFRKNADTTFIITNTDGGTYISYDGMQTNQNLSLNGLNVSQYYSTYTNRINTHIVYAGAQDQGYQRGLVDDGGIMEFDQLISGDYGHIVSGDSGQSIWTNYPGFTMYYPDAVNSTQIIDRDFDGDGHLWIPSLLADPNMPNRAYLAGGSVDDMGANIIQLTIENNVMNYEELPYDFSLGTQASISSMAISPLDTLRWYVMTDNQEFFHSSDGGNTWINSPSNAIPGSHYFYGNAIVPSPVDSNVVYIGGSGYSNAPAFVSNDGGQTFSQIVIGLPNTLIFDMDITLDGSMLFAATEVGPYVYLVADNRWYPIDGLSAPDQAYWSVEYIPSLHVARFGTYGRGIWDFTLCDGLSPQPTAAFVSDVNMDSLQVVFTNASDGAYFYEWNFGDSTGTEELNPVHTFPGYGTYSVTLITSNHCISDTAVEEFTFSQPTLIADKWADISIELFPNPNSGTFSLVNKGEILTDIRLEILNLQGQMIQQEALSSFGADVPVEVKLSKVPSGMYLLRMRNLNGEVGVLKKFVVR